MVKQEPAARAATPIRKKERKSKKKKRKKTKSPSRLNRSKPKDNSHVILDNAKVKRDRIPSASKPFERPDKWRDVAQVRNNKLSTTTRTHIHMRIAYAHARSCVKMGGLHVVVKC